MPSTAQLQQQARPATLPPRELLPQRRYDIFSRTLTPEEELTLHREWGPKLGLKIDLAHIRYLRQRVSEIEAICAGRLSGDTSDAVLRVLVASAVGGEALRMLEIGTLFGVNAALLYDVGSCLFEDVKMLIIDPLDGYYGAAVRDPATGLRISEKTVRRNFDLLRIATQHYTIIPELSDSPAALAAARQRTFNFMFIDGDHSYEGVKKDFELYSPQLEGGGYLVFDNYRDGTCPGVDRFVDECITNGGYECLGSAWRTCVFQKRVQ